MFTENFKNERTLQMSERYFYPMLIENMPDKQGYKGQLIDLNITVEGKSLAELMDNSQKALDKFFDDGLPPKIKGTAPTEITPPKGQSIIIVEFDRIAYKKKHDKATITKAVTMPAWMANIAKEKKINCSQLLQRALLEAFEKE